MKLKQRDFEYFKKECKKWIDRLGLYDWEVYYLFGGLDENNGGGCWANYTGCQATIKLNPIFDDDNLMTKEHYLEVTALHEILELTLMPIQILAESREFDGMEFEHQRHRIIQRLTNLLEKQ